MWRRFEETRFDLVPLDVMLPGGNGLDLCRALRARAPIPIVISARGDETDRLLGLERGAGDHLPTCFGHKEQPGRMPGSSP